MRCSGTRNDQLRRDGRVRRIRCAAMLGLPGVRSSTMFVGLYKGQAVPESATEDSIRHHLSTGQIEQQGG